MMKFHLQKDLDKLHTLKVGDRVLLSGEIYTARDAAHKIIYENKINGKDVIDLKDKAIYYAGPCPAKKGEVIGSVGPTTSSRMDSYTPTLLDSGLKIMVGKGKRSEEVIESLIKNKAIYFVAIGGAGALYASKVKSCELYMFPELLAEAVYKLTVKDFPAVVAIDQSGECIYK